MAYEGSRGVSTHYCACRWHGVCPDDCKGQEVGREINPRRQWELGSQLPPQLPILGKSWMPRFLHSQIRYSLSDSRCCSHANIFGSQGRKCPSCQGTSVHRLLSGVLSKGCLEVVGSSCFVFFLGGTSLGSLILKGVRCLH